MKSTRKILSFLAGSLIIVATSISYGMNATSTSDSTIFQPDNIASWNE